MNTLLPSLWSYRGFILSSIINDFRIRFVRSRIGVLWMALHPLFQILMFALVLSTILSAKLPGIDGRYAYAAFLTAGMLAWSLFSEIVTRCLSMFIENGNLIQKMRFPKICLPVAVVGTAVVNNVFLFLAMVVIFTLFGHFPGQTVFWLPVLLVLTAALAFGLGLTLGILNVFLRDVGHAVPVLLQFGFWMTPIVYMPDILPGPVRSLLPINPMYHVVGMYQDILVFHHSPDSGSLAAATATAICLVTFALWLFSKAEPEMADVL